MGNLQTGLHNHMQITVSEAMLACNVRSGTLRVYATPMMLALMEQTCMECVAPHLETGYGTVGTHLDVAHTSATPLGMQVECDCELIEIDGRRLVFDVVARDERGEIGRGRHERFIVNDERFQQKTDSKLSND